MKDLINSGTYQSYLTRQPQHLLAAIKHAEEKDYVLGIKLVRGAYFVQERQRWKDQGRPGSDPIWPEYVFLLSTLRLVECELTNSKPSTDMAYNNSITTILSTLSHQLNSTEPQKALSVVFGTHNPESCDLVTSNLVKYGLASQVEGSTLLALRDDVVGKVFVAQLYGMSPLSDCLG
jgi:proline dehydrogenase